MDSVLADIDYACANIKSDQRCNPQSDHQICSICLKSRICLFEGTFRKYHTELGLQGTASSGSTAAAAAKAVMDKGVFHHTHGGAR